MGNDEDCHQYTQIGLAFAACNDRNMGNKYAAGGISGVLNAFSGEEVSEPVGHMLSLLEQFLLASGDAEIEKAEGGDT